MTITWTAADRKRVWSVYPRRCFRYSLIGGMFLMDRAARSPMSFRHPGPAGAALEPDHETKPRSVPVTGYAARGLAARTRRRHGSVGGWTDDLRPEADGTADTARNAGGAGTRCEDDDADCA